MRLAYLVSQYPAVNHTYILREVRALRELGWEVQVISIRSPDRPADRLASDERLEAESALYVKQAPFWRVMQAHCATLSSQPWRYLRGLLCAFRLGRFHPRNTLYHLFYFVEAVVAGHWMLERSLQHAHIHFTSTVGLIATRVFPITISITFHGPGEFDDPVGFHLAEKVKVALFVCGISNFAVSQLMGVSDYEDWGKICLSPLGVDPEAFSPQRSRGFSVSFRIMNVGRLATVKGQALLLTAVDRLVKEGRNIRLRLVGDGPLRHALEEIVEIRGLSRNVVFDGFVNQDRVRALYGECDAFVLSSFAEGVPTVLMESMTMEVPCIATWVGGTPELIRHEVDGLLVPPGDADSLAEAIMRLMDEPNLRRRLGTSGRQRVLDKHDLSKNIRRLASTFCDYLTPPSHAMGSCLGSKVSATSAMSPKTFTDQSQMSP